MQDELILFAIIMQSQLIAVNCDMRKLLEYTFLSFSAFPKALFFIFYVSTIVN